MINFEEITIFKNILEIQLIEKGSTDRSKYKIVTEDATYFVKLENKVYSEREINKVKWLYNTYQELGISVVPLIDLIIVREFSVWIFPFFEGESLSEISVSEEQLRMFGKLIAKDIKKLNSVKLDEELFPHFDFNLHYETRKNKLLKYSLDSKYKILFSEAIWDKILKKYNQLYESIKDDEVMLNHNDIKLKNFMIDKENKYYFIDIDPFDATFIGYNLGYSISCFLFKDKLEKERVVLKNFIKIIDENYIYINQFNYFLICDFINKFERYFADYMANSNYVKLVLLNEKDILNEILY